MNIPRLTALAIEIECQVTSRKAAECLLDDMPAHIVRWLHAASDPLVRARRDGPRASSSEADEVRGDTRSLSWRIVEKDPDA